MNLSRKDFLRASGASLLAVAGERLAASLPGASQGAGDESQRPQIAVRWAMFLDMSKCIEKEGCTKCLAACRQTHNIPEIPDRNHEVKWIWKAPFESAFPEQESDYSVERFKRRPVPVLCNHCDQPPCVRVCPTQATWKREDGIVMMDWHRCIGCRYCMAACPYGSRSFNWVDPRSRLASMNPDFPTRTKGIVEKCNFCEERLAKGQPLACVEACPQNAMVFGNLNDPQSPVRRLLRSRYSIRRKPELGTRPQVYYMV